MTTKLSALGQVEIPVSFRISDGITAGQEFVIERMGEGEYHLKPIQPQRAKRAPLDVLRDCPEKDFFAPMEWGTTDQLSNPFFE